MDNFDLNKHIFEAGDFCKLSFPPQKKIIDPWLEGSSINEIVAWRSTGKTWLGLSLFTAISQGESFGPWQTSPVPSLYIDAEMTSLDIQTRLTLLHPSSSPPSIEPLFTYSNSYFVRQGQPSASLLSLAWRKAVQSFLVDRKITLLALDNISALCPGIDENSKKEWDVISDWLITLRHLGITSIFFHHTGKGGSQRGTSGREDQIDISIMLTKPPGYDPIQRCKFILTFNKNRRGCDPSQMQPLEFSLSQSKNGSGEDQVSWKWGSVKSTKKNAIFDLLEIGQTQTEIAKLLGVSAAYVSKVKAEKDVMDKAIGRVRCSP